VRGRDAGGRASWAGCGRGTGGVAGGGNPRRTGPGTGGRVWAGAGAGPAAETLGAWGSLTTSEEEDSAQRLTPVRPCIYTWDYL